MEFRGIGNQNHVRGLNHALVAFEANETVVVIHFHLCRFGCPEGLPLPFHPIPENVAHGHQLRSRVRRQSLRRGTGVSPTAADHPDFQRIPASGVGSPGYIQGSRGDNGGGKG